MEDNTGQTKSRDGSVSPEARVKNVYAVDSEESVDGREERPSCSARTRGHSSAMAVRLSPISAASAGFLAKRENIHKTSPARSPQTAISRRGQQNARAAFYGRERIRVYEVLISFADDLLKASRT